MGAAEPLSSILWVKRQRCFVSLDPARALLRWWPSPGPGAGVPSEGECSLLARPGGSPGGAPVGEGGGPGGGGDRGSGGGPGGLRWGAECVFTAGQSDNSTRRRGDKERA